MTIALGYRSVEEMQEALSHEEYLNWIAFFSEEGFPQDKSDLQHANLIAMIANASGRWKKMFETSDFLPEKWVLNSTDKSIDEQEKADREFGDRLLEMQRLSSLG